jgi:hypothetical protein
MPWAYPLGFGSKWKRWIISRSAKRFAVRVNGRDQREAIWRLRDEYR